MISGFARWSKPCPSFFNVREIGMCDHRKDGWSQLTSGMVEEEQWVWELPKWVGGLFLLFFCTLRIREIQEGVHKGKWIFCIGQYLNSILLDSPAQPNSQRINLSSGRISSPRRATQNQGRCLLFRSTALHHHLELWFCRETGPFGRCRTVKELDGIKMLQKVARFCKLSTAQREMMIMMQVQLMQSGSSVISLYLLLAMYWIAHAPLYSSLKFSFVTS